MSRITMLSGITKGKATSFCFVGSPQLVGKTLCNVARGLVGSCAITIKRLRELAGRSRTMAVRLQLGRADAMVGALLTMTSAVRFASHNRWSLPAPPAGSAILNRDSDY